MTIHNHILQRLLVRLKLQRLQPPLPFLISVHADWRLEWLAVLVALPLVEHMQTQHALARACTAIELATDCLLVLEQLDTSGLVSSSSQSSSFLLSDMVIVLDGILPADRTNAGRWKSCLFTILPPLLCVCDTSLVHQLGR